jgi:hypothetical protein
VRGGLPILTVRPGAIDGSATPGAGEVVRLEIELDPTRATIAAIQYASLDWPSENGRVAYNGLQLISYFLIVFIAAPLMIITGLRMSPAWPRTTE